MHRPVTLAGACLLHSSRCDALNSAVLTVADTRSRVTSAGLAVNAAFATISTGNTWGS
jgi:hypothetical protein